ncbi:MAG: ABC transporter permease [Actinobacteria bacterium]|nr:ABC transporter permease [Actinomycetota bacterium]
MWPRARLFLQEALSSVSSNLSTTIAATMTVLIGMFLLGLFIALGTWVLSWTNDVKRQLVVNVYFCTDVTCENEVSRGQIEDIRSKLVSLPQVKDVQFISSEEALEIQRKRTPALVDNLASNPLPASYKVTPHKGEDVSKIAAQLEPVPPGVEKVNYGKKEADRVLQVAKIIGGIVLTGSLLLIAASILLISNTIRLSIFARRREVEVMKLVGATNWFVRGPFMLEGIITGLIGSILAVILLIVAKEVALSKIVERDWLSNDDVSALSFPLIALTLVLTSLLVGAAGSGITLRRFLRI